MSMLRNHVINKHINENYPNSRIVSFDDPDSGLSFYTSDQLQEVEADWFPLCCQKDTQTGKVVYGGRGGVIHTYTEGETGAGKTTRFAMQSIRALSSLKHKPSFLVVDIHGEIVENLYHHLKENGYEIKILNCDDPEHSDTYNPFAPMVKRCLKSGTIDYDTINQIRRIAEIMQPVYSNNDPIWEMGARSYVNGCILDKMEDLLDEKIPPHCITLYNIIQNHYWLRNELNTQSYPTDLMDAGHYRSKGPGALSVQKMMSVTNNAEKTRASYCGVVENHFDAFGQPSLYQISSSSTIDIDDLIEKPTALFIQSGSTTIGDHLISLMMNELYTTAVRIGKSSATKLLPRKIHCFLDEFANCHIADGPEFIKMLTTSRKFGMYWHMFLQCDAQLNRKYDPDIARIIRSNCTEIFMGSHDYETSLRFAKSCGHKTVESLASRVLQQTPALETVDLITSDQLNLTEPGYMYVKANRHPLLKSFFEPFYTCPEFTPVEDLQSVYPINCFDYKQTEFTPDDVAPLISWNAYRVLGFIHQFEAIAHKALSLSRLEENFPDSLSDSLSELRRHCLIQADQFSKGATAYRTKVTDRQMSYLKFWFDLHPEAQASPEEAPDSDGKISNLKAMQLDDSDFDLQESLDEDSPENFNDLFTLSDHDVFMEGGDENDDEDDNEEDDDEEDLSRFGSTVENLSVRFAESDETFDLTLLDQFTCIPAELVNVLTALNDHKLPDLEDAENINSPVARYMIIEEFLKNHDLCEFETKNDWDMAFSQECTRILQLPFLTEDILSKFMGALQAFVREFTLPNIQEIKRIIDDTCDDDDDDEDDDE